jgi:hypothetical protein
LVPVFISSYTCSMEPDLFTTLWITCASIKILLHYCQHLKNCSSKDIWRKQMPISIKIHTFFQFLSPQPKLYTAFNFKSEYIKCLYTGKYNMLVHTKCLLQVTTFIIMNGDTLFEHVTHWFDMLVQIWLYTPQIRI